jgi:hypothetical protein
MGSGARVLLSKLAPLDTARRTPQMPASDSEISTNLLIVEHMQLLGGLAHLFDRDQIEIGKKTFASPAHSRIDDPLKQDRVCGQIFRIGGAKRHRGAHDLADSDVPTLAR